MLRIKDLYEQYVTLMENVYIGEPIAGGDFTYFLNNPEEEARYQVLPTIEYMKNVFVGNDGERMKNLLIPILTKHTIRNNKLNVKQFFEEDFSLEIFEDIDKKEIVETIRSRAPGMGWRWKVIKSCIPKTEEEWDALKKGKLYTFLVNEGDEEWDTVSEFIDYYDYLINNPNNINQEKLKKMFRIKSWEDVNRKVQEFQKTLKAAEKTLPRAKGGIVIDFGDGYTFQSLASDECRNEEGPKMGHCLRNYNYKDSDIYSLRDSSNEPHVTIEVRNNGVAQIKGKANGPVTDKYIPYIQTFLDKMDFRYNKNKWDEKKFI